MEQHVQSPEVGGGLHSYILKPEGWVGAPGCTTGAWVCKCWDHGRTRSRGPWVCSGSVTGCIWGAEGPPSEGGLRAWARLGDWSWGEREGQVQEPWERKTWGVLWAGPLGWNGHPASPPGCPTETVLPSGPDPHPPPWRTCPSLLLSPELPFLSNMLSPSPDLGPGWGGKEATGGVHTWRGYLAHQAPHGPSGIPTAPPPPGEGHTGATGDHSSPWPGCLGASKALSSVGLSGLSLGQEG